MNKPSSVKTYTCNQCEKVFVNRNSMRSHKRRHMNPESSSPPIALHQAYPNNVHQEDVELAVLKCPKCPENFSSKRKLKTHQSRTHYQPDPAKPVKTKYKCHDCLTHHPTRSSYGLHRSQVHDQPMKTYIQCAKCPKILNMSQMNKHNHLAPDVAKCSRIPEN